MRCSVCGAEGLCWYNAARRLVCRECRDREQIAQRDVRRGQLVGQRMFWIRMDRHGGGANMQVTIEGARDGWMIVRDDAGVSHRVREHNLRPQA